MVHNASGWNCDEFLRLRKEFIDGNLVNGSADYKEYVRLKDLIRGRFDEFVDRKALDELEKLKRVDAGDHLHHILAMFGIKNEAIQKRIVDLQMKLWDKFGIDPFTSAEILTYAPMTGVHGKQPTMVVILALEDAVNGSKKKVLKTLNELGVAARKGRLLNRSFLKSLGLRLSDLEI